MFTNNPFECFIASIISRAIDTVQKDTIIKLLQDSVLCKITIDKSSNFSKSKTDILIYLSKAVRNHKK